MPINRYAGAQVALLIAGFLLVGYDTGLGLTIGLLWIAPVIVAMDLGLSRDRTGWMWGAFLGWLGVLILACMRPQQQQTG